jgi:hypothetical protein
MLRQYNSDNAIPTSQVRTSSILVLLGRGNLMYKIGWSLKECCSYEFHVKIGLSMLMCGTTRRKAVTRFWETFFPIEANYIWSPALIRISKYKNCQSSGKWRRMNEWIHCAWLKEYPERRTLQSARAIQGSQSNEQNYVYKECIL